MAAALSASIPGSAENGLGPQHAASGTGRSTAGRPVTDRTSNAAPATVAAGPPPLSTAITTIAIIAIAMVGSSVSSQLVDLDIADVGGALSVSADQASRIGCVATMAEVVSIPIAAILVRALSLRTLVLWTASLFGLSAVASL